MDRDHERNHHDEQAPGLQELRASNELFYRTFSVSPASIAIATLDDGRFIAVNDGFHDLFGYEPEEVIGRTPEELDIDTDADARRQIYERLRDGEVLRWKDHRIRTKSGEIRDVIGSYVPLEVEGRTCAMYKLVDLTPLRRLEREVLEAEDQVQRRVGLDLHDDLGSLLTGLSLLSQMLAAQLEQAERLEGAALAEAAIRARRIATESKGAYEQARQLVRGYLPLTLTQRGLAGALDELARRTDALKDLSCTFAAEAGVDVDPAETAGHLYRIAQEAINNAVRHSNATRIALTLRQDPDGTLHLRIEDNGDGLPEERLGESPEQSEGSGLRSMFYRTRLIRARLSFEEAAGGGTAVECVLPMPGASGVHDTSD